MIPRVEPFPPTDTPSVRPIADETTTVGNVRSTSGRDRDAETEARLENRGTTLRSRHARRFARDESELDRLASVQGTVDAMESEGCSLRDALAD